MRVKNLAASQFLFFVLSVSCSCLPVRSQSLPTQTQAAQTTAVATDQLCGVTLTPPVLKLRREVEQKAGPVDCLFVAPPDGAYSDETMQPKPRIRLNPADHTYLKSIAHELLHMKLIEGGALDGYTMSGPTASDLGFPPSVYLRFQHNVSSAARWLADAMQHRLFDSEMRAMGFDPWADERASIEVQLGNINRTSLLGHTMNYVDAGLLFKDDAFMRKYAAWLRNFGLDDAVNKGEIIVNSINKANPHKADEMAAELSNDLTILFWDGPQPPPHWFRFIVTPTK